jgi:hypothetical protein
VLRPSFLVDKVDLSELTRHLKTKAEFSDLDRWTITAEELGRTSQHTYRLRRDDKDYFLKEVKDNERDILKRLVPLHLRHVIKVVYPDLLDSSILVAVYVRGGPIKSKDLEPGLIRDFAAIQNHFNSSAFVSEAPKDDGFFFGRFLIRCFETGYNKLLQLQARGFTVVNRYVEIAEHLMQGQNQIVAEFSAMPFAQQHHDLREGSILGSNPQVIIDWGSSYGYGPFLYDLAPFLFNHKQNLEVLVQHSDICRGANPSTIERWLYIATCARFMSFFTYLQEQAEAEKVLDVEAFLEYHYETYGGLLQRNGSIRKLQ